MSTDAPADIAKRFIDEIFVAGRVEAVDDLVTMDFVSHGLPGTGPDVMKAAVKRVTPALSDVTMEIRDIFGEGDRVAVRLESSAVPSGEFMGMPPSGKRYSVEEIHIFRIAGGKVAEHWHQFDSAGMMRQLGVMPGPGSTKA